MRARPAAPSSAGNTCCPAEAGPEVRASALCFCGIALAILLIAGNNVPKGIAGPAAATLTGAMFLLTGSVLSYFNIGAGDVVIQRVTRTRENWQSDTLRSFIECGSVRTRGF